jgi:hypothetical protein
MSILTLDTAGDFGGPFDVAVQKAGHAEPRQVGSRFYTFNGNEKRTVRAELMVLPVILSNIDVTNTANPVTTAAIRACFANANAVLCAGVVFNNALADVLCSAEITDEMEVGGPNWVLSATLYEVENVGTIPL